jgi:DNA-binding MarR family transcriptional regulator
MDADAAPREALRLWLRLLTCTALAEGELRRRLRAQFGTTLPRFDLLAALDRAPEGMTLGEVSRRMMVSNGNGLAARMEAEGLVERRLDAGDRRAFRLRLTERGAREFARQSRAHAAWVAELLGGLDPADGQALHRLLGDAKQSIAKALA